MKTITISAIFYLTLASIQALGMENNSNSNSPLMGANQTANISPVTNNSPIMSGVPSPITPTNTVPSSLLFSNKLTTTSPYAKYIQKRQDFSDDESSSSSSESSSASKDEPKKRTASPTKQTNAKKVKFADKVDNDSRSSSDDSDSSSECDSEIELLLRQL